jgi:hypothetical protein
MSAYPRVCPPSVILAVDRGVSRGRKSASRDSSLHIHVHTGIIYTVFIKGLRGRQTNSIGKCSLLVHRVHAETRSPDTSVAAIKAATPNMHTTREHSTCFNRASAPIMRILPVRSDGSPTWIFTVRVVVDTETRICLPNRLVRSDSICATKRGSSTRQSPN